MGNAKLLYRLQQIDHELATTRQTITELQTKLEQDEQLRLAREAVGEAEHKLKRAQSLCQDQEAELEKLSEKLLHSQDRLYSGVVTHPKELQSLQEEVSLLTRRRDQLQDTLLECMVSVDEARAELQRAQEIHAVTEREHTEKQQEIHQALNKAAARMEQLTRERADVERRLAPSDIQLYEDLCRRKGSAPVARLRGGMCGRCGVAVPVAIASQVRADDQYIFCPSCGRLLVAE